jgi:DNA-binding LytR/AlgR family response regulator
MNVLLIEDEKPAQEHQARTLRELDASIVVVDTLDSVSGAVRWLTHQTADLIFLDIHLEDNLSFAIFDSITITCPIVFTTATDELSTRAFALKKIDFLLKPIIQSELAEMIKKYKKLPVNERPTVNASLFTDIINKHK